MNTEHSGWKLNELIGVGKFGEVWKAESSIPVPPFIVESAVKIIFEELGSNEMLRLERCLDFLRDLSHPNVITILEYGSVLQGRLYLAMELAEENLHQRAMKYRQHGSALPVLDLLTYFRETSGAIDYFHSFNIVHGCIKPHDILMVKDHAKISDFDLVHKSNSQLGANHIIDHGTLPYIAPEVWQGHSCIQSDIYSLACSYSELRLQAGIFPVTDGIDWKEAHLRLVPQLGALAASEQQVLNRALAKDPNQRFSCCLEFIDALTTAV